MQRNLYILLVLGWTAAAQGTAPSAYRIETVAGSSRNGDGGPAIAAQSGAIQGIALDRLGNLYFSDTDHHRVRKVAAMNGIVTTVAGTGDAGFGGDGAPATAAQLNLPYGLATDSAGNLFIADLGNNRVRRVALDGTISTVAGTGAKGSTGDGGPANAARLFTPRNVLVDASGVVYISEFEGHRIRRIGADGKISTLAGTGTAGFRGDGGPAANAQLAYPAGMAMDRAGALYFADSQNNRVRKVAGGTISTVLAPASGVSNPRAIALNAAGTIYVADAASTVVSAYDAAGKATVFAGLGVKDFSGDGGPAVKAFLTNVLDLLADTYGNVYLADDQRIRKVDLLGNIQTAAGDGYRVALGDQGKAAEALLLRPMAVALDPTGSLWIADTGTNRLRTIAKDGTITTAATGFYSPMGVAVDAQGTVFAADSYHHRIVRVTSDHQVVTVMGTGKSGTGSEFLLPLETELRGPRGICFDRTGAMLIVDTANHRVLRTSPAALVEIAAGNGSPGDAGDGGPARSAQLNQPNACAVDSLGNVFIADTMSHRIRKVTPDGTIATVAGSGTAGFSGDEGAATGARLFQPQGVAVDDSGHIFIADTGNHRIRVVTGDGTIHTVAGHDTPGFKGDDGPASEALLDSPSGLFLDGSGVLYVSDTGNNRIRRLVAEEAVVSDPQVYSPLRIRNAASRREGPVAPGEVVVISAPGIGPENGVAAGYDEYGRLPVVLGGSEVRFDGAPAPLLYAQSGEIHAQAPYSLGNSATTRIEVFYRSSPAGAADVSVAAAAPGLYPVAVNQDGSANSKSRPSAAGTVLTFYATGEGLTDGANVTGQAVQAPYPRPALPVTVTIGGTEADAVDAFSTPGVAGMLQINARVPAGLQPGAAEAKLTVGGTVSQGFPVWIK
jgi:uncharacterized protein (TIGR03437 family)